MKNEVNVSMDMVLISIYNAHEEKNKVYINDKDFFANTFENAYDAAWAVSLSGKWHWTDDFVYFDTDGYLTSFSRCDDETCPIDMDKIDIDYLIRALQDLQKNKRYVVNDIPRAIHEALE